MSTTVPARLLRAALALLIGLVGATASAGSAQAASLTQVSSFGSNPGNLSMYSYRPDGLSTGRPLVVLLHGCTQNAAGYFADSGWRKYADQWGFALVLPQTGSANNSLSCFNWFETGDTARGQGEAASIRSMVGYAVANYGTDAGRVYVTGLSAGGAMTAVMLATYPDVFSAGSIGAGLPYRCATSSSQASTCQHNAVAKTPQQWGDLARGGYPGYTGPRPRAAIWQGLSDSTVVPANGTELRDQWTNVRGVAQSPTSTQSLPGGTSLKVYGNNDVRLYEITGMGHGLPVDPGSGADQCGTAAAYFLDTICSAGLDARFFGLDGGVTPPAGLPAPAGLSVTGATATSVSLRWNTVSGAAGYHVYRDGVRVTGTAATATAYTDGGLVAGTSYQYQVSAVDSAGLEGTRSGQVGASTTGSAPVCVTASNYAHTTAGRAHQSGGNAFANGSNQNMGLWNTFVITTLKQTGADYWVIGTC